MSSVCNEERDTVKMAGFIRSSGSLSAELTIDVVLSEWALLMKSRQWGAEDVSLPVCQCTSFFQYLFINT